MTATTTSLFTTATLEWIKASSTKWILILFSLFLSIKRIRSLIKLPTHFIVCKNFMSITNITKFLFCLSFFFVVLKIAIRIKFRKRTKNVMRFKFLQHFMVSSIFWLDILSLPGNYLDAILLQSYDMPF